MKSSKRLNRRSFLKTSGTGAAAAATLVAGAPAVLAAKSPNEILGVGHIGLGVRGGELIQQVAGSDKHDPIPNTKVVAVCDVYKPHLKKGVERSNNPSVREYLDYKDLLADPAVDVVVIATPDHWHAQMVIDAANAGKHIYIEKCWTRTLAETKAMYAAVKKNKIVMQLGHNSRESAAAIPAIEIVKSGVLGPITFVRTGTFRNRALGKDEWRWFGGYNIFDRPDPAQVKSDLDWKRWLGPAPARDFDFERFWHWRCYWDYGTGIAGDLLSHSFDFAQFILGYGIPDTCACSGQVGLLKDGREAPDIWNVTYEYLQRGCTLTYACTFNSMEFGQELEIRGKDAIMMWSGTTDFAVYPERNSVRYKPDMDKGKIEQGKPFIKFDPAKTPPQPTHMQDFFNCIRTGGKPKDNEDEAFIEAVTCIMSVEAYKQKRTVQWDPVKQEIV
ncbi:MAG: Gfo/Idh/MocA family oxidoreductase [Candidatus Sumerlaeia bacterium]|nr:Gfo/Idh/MocA family oxidoreductase [Candidatus Sumerlaeia bacterium]